MNKINQNIVYVLINPSFPDWVKIGRCSDLDKRLKSLSSNTAVPLPFECFYACEVDNGIKIEKKLHMIFHEARVSKHREFFKVDPEKVVAVMQLVAIKEVQPISATTPDDEIHATRKEIVEHNLFNFVEAGISLGSEIYLTRDPNIKAIVIDQHRVSYDNEAYDFTELTKKLLKKHLNRDRQSISTPRYWSYDGEMLVSRKHRLEKIKTL